MKQHDLFNRKEIGRTGKVKTSPEPVTIVDARPAEGKVSLTLSMTREFYEELRDYLKKKGYVALGREKDGIAILLKLGLSEITHTEREKGREYTSKHSSRHASIHYQTTEYYDNNGAIVKGLKLHLKENQALKLQLKEQGLGKSVSDDEWDHWDEATIDAFYQRYVFCK